jgi:hypothetical protein
VTRRLLWLLGGGLLFWLLTAWPARWLGGGDAALVYCATAVVLCLIPGVLTLVWASLVWNQPEMHLLAVMGGTAIRISFVMLAAFLLESSVPYFREQAGFWLWVLAAYLFTLPLEMVLLLVGRPGSRRP